VKIPFQGSIFSAFMDRVLSARVGRVLALPTGRRFAARIEKKHAKDEHSAPKGHERRS
jgi:hypothetical protein